MTTHLHSPPTQLITPQIKAVLNFMTTKLKIRASSVPNAHGFEVQYRIGTGPWQAGGSYPNPRAMVLSDLTPGTAYELRVRAIGGSTGYSDWSDVVIHMAT